MSSPSYRSETTVVIAATSKVRHSTGALEPRVERTRCRARNRPAGAVKVTLIVAATGMIRKTATPRGSPETTASTCKTFHVGSFD